jgi:hypothetical protein
MLIFFSLKSTLIFNALDIGVVSTLNFYNASLIPSRVAVTSLNIRAFLLALLVFSLISMYVLINSTALNMSIRISRPSITLTRIDLYLISIYSRCLPLDHLFNTLILVGVFLPSDVLEGLHEVVEDPREVESEARVEVPLQAGAQEVAGVGEEDDAREGAPQEVGAEQV